MATSERVINTDTVQCFPVQWFLVIRRIYPAIILRCQEYPAVKINNIVTKWSAPTCRKCWGSWLTRCPIQCILVDAALFLVNLHWIYWNSAELVWNWYWTSIEVIRCSENQVQYQVSKLDYRIWAIQVKEMGLSCEHANTDLTLVRDVLEPHMKIKWKKNSCIQESQILLYLPNMDIYVHSRWHL